MILADDFIQLENEILIQLVEETESGQSDFKMKERLRCLLVLKHALEVQTDVLKRSVFELRDRARSDSVQQLADVACINLNWSATVRMRPRVIVLTISA